METLTYRTLDGPLAALPPEEAEAFAAGIRGGVITPADADYEAARRVWNGMVDRHPALIARCLGSQDVRRAIDFARDHRMLVSVRGGGHHIAGKAVAEDEAGRVDSAYGQNYARLQEVKRQYDPDNLFRINQNIAPAVLARTA
ncbi:BBE domain-containing protein [Halomonas sp.]|uniref:BBE domain-containing protein n=1 Tax=Halomonas sp. TaxID=1486246 RepID=UPI00298E44B5|nr:BBE domain-containing protein [Halomonas sp.]MDW7748126.1 BBE domain-containing protein [Halomonas sp.]